MLVDASPGNWKKKWREEYWAIYKRNENLMDVHKIKWRDNHDRKIAGSLLHIPMRSLFLPLSISPLPRFHVQRVCIRSDMD